MPDHERARVTRSWSGSGTIGVVDETLIDFPADWDATPPLPMAAHDPTIITVGSASKSYWGGLRLGWIRAATDQIAQLSESRLALDLAAPVLEQLVLLHLMADRQRILEHQRQRVRLSRSALCDAMKTALPDWVLHQPAGGLSIWCELPEALSTAVVAAAERQDLLLAAGPRFAVDGGLERFLRLACTQHPATMLDAVARTAQAWDDAQSNRKARSHAGHLVA
jgi:DNA-binding transcriptional MocR family regulator